MRVLYPFVCFTIMMIIAMGSKGKHYLLETKGANRSDEESRGKCTFSRDCQKYESCQNIADAGCGRIIGSWLSGSGDHDCEVYTDCSCRDNKDSCFCQNGFCEERRYECHTNSDCKKLSKCRGKECSCLGSLCEFHCNNDEDCEGFDCNITLGYKCKCENSLCASKEKKKE